MKAKEKYGLKQVIGFLIIGVLIGYSIIYYVQFAIQLSDINGTYESISSEEYSIDTTYELTISKTGKLKITDIGAGNHVMEGQLTKDPVDNHAYTLKCGYDGEYDGKQFLDMETRINAIRIYPDNGHKFPKENRKILCITNDKGTVYFAEKN